MYWALIGVLPKDLFLDCQMPDYHKRIILSDACTFARCLDYQMPGYSTRCLHICQMHGHGSPFSLALNILLYVTPVSNTSRDCERRR